jgi:hypothetical protein
MPDSYGKRQRDVVKSRKAAASEQRRVARNQRRRAREAGVLEPGAFDAPEVEGSEQDPEADQTQETQQAGETEASE